MEGLVWMSDHINQSEVEFLPRYLMHSISEHRIYFYSEKPNRVQGVEEILETLTSTTKTFTDPSLSLPHPQLTRERSNSLSGPKDMKPTTPGVSRRPSLTKRLRLQRASSLSEKKSDSRKIRDCARNFRSLDSLDGVGVVLGDPGSRLELQRDPTPSVSVVNSSLLTNFIFAFCLRITVPPISCHDSSEESEECLKDSNLNKTLYLCLQKEVDLFKWLHSLSTDLERIRNRRFHLYPHLSVTISEVKGVSPKKTLFCEVCLDSVPYAKTAEKLSNKGLLFWGEKFEFSEFPSMREVTVLLYKGKTKRPQEVGRVEIPAGALYEQGVVEKWFSLKQDRERRKGQATIRLKFQYQVLNILPFVKYEDLQSYIADDYHLVIRNLAPQLPVQHKNSLAKNLVRIFYSTGDVTRYLVDVVVSEVDDPNIDSNLIFRGNTLATKSMDFYMRLVAGQYLQSVLLNPLLRYLTDTLECEVDPERMPSTATPLQTQNNLIRHLQSIWDAIYKSRSSIPLELQLVFNGIQTELGSDKQKISNTVVVACIFLRFFCASIMSPSLFDIIKEYPSEKGARKLTLVAKTLQTLANFSRFENKESYLTFLNHWLEKEQNKMTEFIAYVSNCGYERRDSFQVDLTVSPSPLQIVSLGVELSTLHHFLQEVIETIPQQTQEPLMPLTILLNALTCVESAFRESKDKFIWISSTPEKCMSSVGVSSYNLEPTTATSIESESTGEDTSDMESGQAFLNWPQKVPSTDLTWSKQDVIHYNDSLSMRSSSEDENWNPIPPPLPGRGASIKASQELLAARKLSSTDNSPTLSPLEKLIEQQSLDEIQDRLEAVQRSFRLTSEETKPFVRRQSPSLSNYPGTGTMSPSKSSSHLHVNKYSPVDSNVSKFKNVNEIRRRCDLYDRLPPKSSDYIPKLQHSRSDTGESSRHFFGAKRIPPSSQSIHSLNTTRTHIPPDQNGNHRYKKGVSTHIKIEKRSARSPTDQNITRSTSIQVISNSPSPPQLLGPVFTKASSAENPRGANSPTGSTPVTTSHPYKPLDKWSSDSRMNSIFSMPQRPSHPPKTIEVSQSLERLNNPPRQIKGSLSKLSETIALGHEKLERNLSQFSGGSSGGEDDNSYYRKECARLQRDLSKTRAETQEVTTNLTAKHKEMERWRDLAVQQEKELRKLRESSEILALNRQIIESRSEVLKLRMENEQLKQPPALSIRNTDNDSLRDQIDTWKGLALDRLNRIRCLEAANATLMNGITQLEALQDIMTNGEVGSSD